MRDKLAALVASRRFWLALAAVLVNVSDGLGLGLSAEAVQNVTLAAAAWIVGDSLRKT